MAQGYPHHFPVGGKLDGVPRQTGFDITAASEVMAILALAASEIDTPANRTRVCARSIDGRADPDIQGFYWTLVPRDVKWGEPEFGPVRAEFHEVLAEVMLDIAKAAAEGWRHEQALLAIQDLCVPVLDTRVEVATPPEFANGMPGIWSPEHLFVAAVNSCLMTTYLAIADNSKLPFVSFSSRATGTPARPANRAESGS